MSYELPSGRILLHFILITQILQLSFASQAVFTVNGTIQVPVSLGVTSRDDDALYVQTVFDEVLNKVSGKVNMSFGYVKECVHLQYATLPINLMRTHNIAYHRMMSNMGCGVLQTGSIARETCNSCACTSTLHRNSGGTLSCVKTKRERMKLAASGLPRSAQ
jgi:hypothetical protein